MARKGISYFLKPLVEKADEYGLRIKDMVADLELFPVLENDFKWPIATVYVTYHVSLILMKNIFIYQDHSTTAFANLTYVLLKSNLISRAQMMMAFLCRKK